MEYDQWEVCTYTGDDLLCKMLGKPIEEYILDIMLENEGIKFSCTSFRNKFARLFRRELDWFCILPTFILHWQQVLNKRCFNHFQGCPLSCMHFVVWKKLEDADLDIQPPTSSKKVLRISRTRKLIKAIQCNSQRKRYKSWSTWTLHRNYKKWSNTNPTKSRQRVSLPYHYVHST